MNFTLEEAQCLADELEARQRQAVKNNLLLVTNNPYHRHYHVAVFYPRYQVYYSLCQAERLYEPEEKGAYTPCPQCEKIKAIVNTEDLQPIVGWLLFQWRERVKDLATRTMGQFKPGDKVYILPYRPRDLNDDPYYIRATVTEADPNDRWGYHLRAFEQDCPGIHMFNKWDRDLIPRTSKAKKRLPANFNEEPRYSSRGGIF